MRPSLLQGALPSPGRLAESDAASRSCVGRRESYSVRRWREYTWSSCSMDGLGLLVPGCFAPSARCSFMFLPLTVRCFSKRTKNGERDQRMQTWLGVVERTHVASLVNICFATDVAVEALGGQAVAWPSFACAHGYSWPHSVGPVDVSCFFPLAEPLVAIQHGGFRWVWSDSPSSAFGKINAWDL